MKEVYITRLVLVLARSCLLSGWTPVSAAEAARTPLEKDIVLPLSFERDGNSEYVVRGQGYSIGLHASGARFVLQESTEFSMEFVHGRRSAGTAENLPAFPAARL